MDRAKVFKDYFISSQNTVLIPNSEFGRRKFLNVGVNRSLSASRIEEIQQAHTTEMRAANKQWMHPPDALLRGHVLYCVKFLGECEVDCPKGTDIVRDAIRKRKFNKHIKKAEGQKTPKVELTISVDGVTIQEQRSKFVLHSYPLHRISYCADDKSDKRMFTFIAKAADTNQHFCYVFASDKSAEEITLTIGQAFDLAYRRFLDTQGKDMDAKKQQLLLQKKVQTLEKENKELKQRIEQLEKLKDRSDVEQYKATNGILDLASVTDLSTDLSTDGTVVELTHVGESTTESPFSSQPGTPQMASVGRRLQNLVLEESKPQTNGTTPHVNSTPGVLSPPPPSTRSRSGHKHATSPVVNSAPTTPSQQNQTNDDLASVFMSQQQPQQDNHVFDPFASPSTTVNASGSDPFGMGSFNPAKPPPQDLDSAIKSVDRDFLDLQSGFSQGLSFGTEDFNVGDFDPLNQTM